MIQIQIRYDEPEEKELAEFYQSRILNEHIATAVPVVVVQRASKRRARSVTLPDGTIEIYDADGKRTAVIV